MRYVGREDPVRSLIGTILKACLDILLFRVGYSASTASIERYSATTLRPSIREFECPLYRSTTHDGGIGGDSHGHDVRVVAQRASVQSISLVVSGLGYPFSGLRHIVAIVIGTIVAAKTHYTEV